MGGRHDRQSAPTDALFRRKPISAFVVETGATTEGGESNNDNGAREVLRPKRTVRISGQ
jgi:hypothetical protein